MACNINLGFLGYKRGKHKICPDSILTSTFESISNNEWINGND